jgi:hypothetical protein
MKLEIVINGKVPNEIGPSECNLCDDEWNGYWDCSFKGFPKSEIIICDECKKKVVKNA